MTKITMNYTRIEDEYYFVDFPETHPDILKPLIKSRKEDDYRIENVHGMDDKELEELFPKLLENSPYNPNLLWIHLFITSYYHNSHLQLKGLSDEEIMEIWDMYRLRHEFDDPITTIQFYLEGFRKDGWSRWGGTVGEGKIRNPSTLKLLVDNHYWLNEVDTLIRLLGDNWEDTPELWDEALADKPGVLEVFKGLCPIDRYVELSTMKEGFPRMESERLRRIHHQFFSNGARDYFIDLNPEFWNGGFTVKELVHGGVKYTELFSILKGLPKPEILAVMKELENVHVGRMFVTDFEDLAINTWLKTKVKEEHLEAIEQGWLVQYTKSWYGVYWTKLKWAMRNLHHLVGTTTHHLPRGESMEVHNHIILQEVEDRHLVNGEKTSYRRVVDMVMEEDNHSRANWFLNSEKPMAELKTTKEDERVVQLLHAKELVAETQRMKNCVGNSPHYYSYGVEGKTYIFHVDDGSELGATVELSPRNGEWHVPQAMNYDNRPSPRARKIMEDWAKNVPVPKEK